jgi:hypothetical protein
MIVFDEDSCVDRDIIAAWLDVDSDEFDGLVDRGILHTGQDGLFKLLDSIVRYVEYIGGSWSDLEALAVGLDGLETEGSA